LPARPNLKGRERVIVFEDKFPPGFRLRSMPGFAMQCPFMVARQGLCFRRVATAYERIPRSPRTILLEKT
jgi:hypothetical protein